MNRTIGPNPIATLNQDAGIESKLSNELYSMMETCTLIEIDVDDRFIDQE